MFVAPPLPAPVAAAHSWYLGDLDRSRLAQLARDDETAAIAAGLTAAVVVLDAGDPDVAPGSTLLPDHRGHATEVEIGSAVSAYAYGWTTRPRPSNEATALPLTLVIATSNSGRYVDAAHGAGWAAMVAAVGAANPSVDVVGGLDDEPDYGPASETLAWLRGYRAGPTHPFVDLGDCACTPGQALPAGWTLAQRATVAEVGRVLPQQYRTSGIDATRWAYLDRIAGNRLRFLGVLTETRACAGPPARECAGIDQSPTAALAGLTLTLGRPVTAATDIGYLVPPAVVAAREHRLRNGLLVGLLALLVLSGAFILVRRNRSASWQLSQ